MTENKYFRITSIAAVLTLVVALFLSTIRVDALSSSSLQLTDSRPTQSSSYTFSSSSFSGATLNCITLDFNTAADGSGSVPTGLTSTGASLNVSSDLITPGSWTQAYGVNGTLQLTSGAEVPAGSGSLIFDSITNGSTANTTYFGIFNTYTNADCTNGLTDSVVVTFIYKDGALVSLTIDPTLSFTVAPVLASQVVSGGVSTTIGSSATAVNFGNSVNDSTNGVSAHDLTASTNASGGFALYIRHTGLLTNGSGNTIDNLPTHTNASPGVFTAPGTEAWGYTTNDITLETGAAARFSGPLWAQFSTSNELVGDETGLVGSGTTRVGHQVGVSGTTEAGTYQTTIIYTAASTY